MDYFLDTCVEVGYVFCTDPWNNESVKIFEANDSLYYSFNVDKEFRKKYHEIYRENRNFLISLRDILNLEADKEKLLSLNDLNQKSWQVNLKKEIGENKKEKMIETLWQYSKSKHLNTESENPVCKVKTLLSYISKFIRNLSNGLLKRKMAFENKVMIHTRHDRYSKLYNKLDENDVHHPDNDIVLDAHDLSLKMNIALEFITADKNMVNNVNKIIGLLNINNFHYLKDFAN